MPVAERQPRTDRLMKPVPGCDCDNCDYSCRQGAKPRARSRTTPIRLARERLQEIRESMTDGEGGQ